MHPSWIRIKNERGIPHGSWRQHARHAIPLDRSMSEATGARAPGRPPPKARSSGHACRRSSPRGPSCPSPLHQGASPCPPPPRPRSSPLDLFCSGGSSCADAGAMWWTFEALTTVHRKDNKAAHKMARPTQSVATADAKSWVGRLRLNSKRVVDQNI